MKKIILATFVFMFLLVSFWVTAEETGNNPVAVSPGSETEVVTVWQSCPTFSWSAVDQAASYRIAVFESLDGRIAPYESMAVISSPAISKQIPGPALSWTLSSEEKLKTGSMYTWYVQAVDASGNAIGSWSGGRVFQVEQEVRFAGVAEKLGEILKSYGVKDDTITNVLSDMKSEVQEVVVLGGGTGSKNTTGLSGVKGTEGDYNTFYGKYAGNSTTGTQNTFVGASAGYTNSTGYYNTFLGYRAGYLNNAWDNTFLGNHAGEYNTSGVDNTFVGMYAGRNNDDAHYNTFIGTSAGYNSNGTRNSFLGYRAGYYATGNYNTYIGYQAGHQDYYSNTASNNTFVGDSAGYDNTTGDRGTFLGYYAGFHNTSGDDNTFLGYLAGAGNTSGYSNTILGNSAGYSNQTGTNNIFLGYQAGYNETGSNKLYIENSNSTSPLIYGEFDNNIVTINGRLGIGTTAPSYPVELSTTGEAAEFLINRTDGACGVISAGATHVFIGAKSNHDFRLITNDSVKMTILPSGDVGIGTTAPSYPLHMASGAYCSTGGTWTNASSRALKENIENLSTAEAVDALTKLNPVKYNYKVDKADKHVGFIAEDAPELVATSDRKGLSPMDVTAVLTKVVQELRKENQEYKKIISDLQERLATLEKK
ncbi:MAG: tail fiber domain-containing protein [Candidatus Aminicenantes bacterium]|nr:tail fiber domain-containing protein [Candidatus Aminicenantes bacterium]